jgi:hypothetical protein
MRQVRIDIGDKDRSKDKIGNRDKSSYRTLTKKKIPSVHNTHLIFAYAERKHYYGYKDIWNKILHDY